MKKAFLFLASAALLLSSCAKDNFSFLKKSQPVDVTFTAQMDGGVSTRAAVDGDGAAANVNRCIAEVYYGDELFTRQYAKVTSKQCTFTISLVSNRTYKVAFWADCVEDPDAAIETDKYYATESLKAISLKGEYAGNDDSRDAFFHCGEYTVAQAGTNFNATLKRPFAQINVITTDWGKAAKTTGLAPDQVTVKLKNPMVNFNALTGAASQAATPADLTYTANIYTTPAKTVSEATLSMDYIFAAATKEIIDIDWKALKSGNADVEHKFTSVPYQRNYRTNIKGALLTTTGQWNVTVDPIWATEDIPYDVVKDIAGANDVINNNLDKSQINIKFQGQPNDAGEPGQTKAITSRAILTTPLPSTTTLNIIVEAETEDIYIGDYVSATSTEVATSGLNATVVNINVPTGGSIKKLVINTPSKTVYLNGVKASSTGTINEVDAITSNNTLIIEENQTVNTLTIRQGSLKIHGTVGAAVIPSGHGDIYVRDCEGLSQSVYEALAPYIDSDNGYAGVKKGENNWDIVAGAAPIVAQIGETKYYKLEAALDAAMANDEIDILSNCGLSSQRTFDKNLSFDLNGNKMSFSASDVRALVLSNNAEISFEDGDLEITNANSLGLFDVTSCKSLSLTSVNMSGNTSDAKGKSGFIFQGNDGDCAVTLTDCSGTTNYRIYRGQGTNSTLSVTNGEYNCAGYNVAFQDAGTATYTGVKITVDGTGTSDYQSGIYVSGKTAEINNCTISCPNSKKGAITVCMEGTATVNGGTYSGKIAVDVLYSGGVVNINGGTYTSSGETDSYSLYADSRQSGNQYVGTDKTANIIVNSGTVTGSIGIQHKAKVYVHGGTINNDATLTGEGNPIIADGGTFAFDPSAYVVTGYIAQAQGTTPETWKVIEDPFAGKVAKIGEVGYATFEAALGAVKPNETIQLLNDVTVSSSYTYDQSLDLNVDGVTLDLNQKLLTVTNSSAFIVKSNNVTVKNGKINAGPKSTAGAPYQSYSIKSSGASNLKMQALVMLGGMNLCNNSTVEISDCNITAGEWAAIMVQSGTTITVKSGTYQSREDYRTSSSTITLAENSGSVATIEGGTFDGNPVAYSGTSYIAKGGYFRFRTTNYWSFFTIPNGYHVIDTSGEEGTTYYNKKTVVKDN